MNNQLFFIPNYKHLLGTVCLQISNNITHRDNQLEHKYDDDGGEWVGPVYWPELNRAGEWEKEEWDWEWNSNCFLYPPTKQA